MPECQKIFPDSDEGRESPGVSSSGIMTHARRYTMRPVPIERTVTTAQISRMTVGSTSRCSPRPPQTPPSIRSFFERNNRFIIKILFFTLKYNGVNGEGNTNNLICLLY